MMLVAARLLLLAGAGRRCNGDRLHVIAGSVSVATGSILDLLLRYDPVDFCQNQINQPTNQSIEQ